MTVLRAATEEYLAVNPPGPGAFANFLGDLTGEAATDTDYPLVYMLFDDNTAWGIYVNDGSEITARTYAHDELDEFIANGGVIEGYNP